jgi:hypothetical protein
MGTVWFFGDFRGPSAPRSRHVCADWPKNLYREDAKARTKNKRCHCSPSAIAWPSEGRSRKEVHHEVPDLPVPFASLRLRGEGLRPLSTNVGSGPRYRMVAEIPEEPKKRHSPSRPARWQSAPGGVDLRHLRARSVVSVVEAKELQKPVFKPTRTERGAPGMMLLLPCDVGK